MAYPLVQPGRVQPGGPSVRPGFPGSGGASSASTDYVDPNAGSVIVAADDAATEEVDPNAGSLIIV